jgi:Flp pilus assembly protein TadD
MVEATESLPTLCDRALEKMRLGRFAAAEHELQIALRVAPDEPVLLSHYGLCLALQERLERGLDLCRRAAQRAPSDTVVRVNLGRAYRLAGDKAAAHRAFVQAWHAAPGDVAAASELARMGIRRPPVLSFLPRSHWSNRVLGRLRTHLERGRAGPRS